MKSKVKKQKLIAIKVLHKIKQEIEKMPTYKAPAILGLALPRHEVLRVIDFELFRMEIEKDYVCC